MSGFSGIYIFDQQYKKHLDSFRFPDTIDGGYISKSDYAFDQKSKIQWYSNAKFKKDGIFLNCEHYLLGFDGVKLSEANFNNIRNADAFVKELEKLNGTFSAMFKQSPEQRITICADKTGSKQIFYYWSTSFFAFSSSIFLLQNILRHFDLKPTISLPASYIMLNLGYLLEDLTMVAEIKKIKAGHFIAVDEKGLKIEKYHDYFKKTCHEKLNDELLHELNDRFKKSIQSEYDKDLENGFDHIATLSGGLDTRLNVTFAHQYGYRNLTCVTYSEQFKSDEIIARKITDDYAYRHLILLLNKGSHLLDIQTPLVLNNCSVAYFGAAHTLSAVKRINFDNYGLLHNGILAESSKGTYLSGKSYAKPGFDRHFTISMKLYDRLDQTLLQQYFDRYPTDEMFLTYNRGFNCAHNGSWMTQPFTESVYTYMDPWFADLAYSIHPKLRYDGYLTIEWIRKFNTSACNYIWHRGIKPTNDPLRKFMSRVSYRMKILLTGKYDVAFPVKEWYASNSHLRNFIQSEFDESLSWDVMPVELSKDLKLLFSDGSPSEKLLCISFLKSIELLFIA